MIRSLKILLLVAPLVAFPLKLDLLLIWGLWHLGFLELARLLDPAL